MNVPKRNGVCGMMETMGAGVGGELCAGELAWQVRGFAAPTEKKNLVSRFYVGQLMTT